MLAAFIFNSNTTHAMHSISKENFSEVGINNYEYYGKKLEKLATDYLAKDGITIGEKIGCGYNGMVYCGTDKTGKKVAIKLSFPNTSTLALTNQIPVGYHTPYMSYNYKYLGELELARRYVNYDTYYKAKYDKKENVKKYEPVYLGKGLPKIHAVYRWLDLDYYDSEYWSIAVVMDWIEGETLENYIKHHSYSADNVLSWSIGILNALKPLHEKGWKHRDLCNPSNIMIKPDDSICVIDLGKAIDWYDYNLNTMSPNYPIGYIYNHDIDPDYCEISNLIKYLLNKANSNDLNLKDRTKDAVNKSKNCEMLYRNLTNLLQSIK